MKTLYKIYAMRRSGHHGIINWICRQKRPCIFINEMKKHECFFYDVNKIYTHSDLNCNFNNKVLNYEDALIPNYITTKHTGFDNVINIVVIRDIYNLTASRLKFGVYTTNTNKLWINHILNKDKLIFINFNKWVCNKDYRREIAKSIQINNFTDDGINELWPLTKSSWDGIKYINKASEMDVNKRYKNISNIETYFDNNIKSLNRKYFGDT